MTDNIRRGDIVYISVAGQPVGCEQGGGRPAVVIQNNVGNQRSNTIIVVYLTTSKKPSLPTHANVFAKTASTAMCEQICTVDKSRVDKVLGTVSTWEMRDIECGLCVSLGLGFEVVPKIGGNIDSE